MPDPLPAPAAGLAAQIEADPAVQAAQQACAAAWRAYHASPRLHREALTSAVAEATAYGQAAVRAALTAGVPLARRTAGGARVAHGRLCWMCNHSTIFVLLLDRRLTAGAAGATYAAAALPCCRACYAATREAIPPPAHPVP